jgi:hypothetical protein
LKEGEKSIDFNNDEIESFTIVNLGRVRRIKLAFVSSATVEQERDEDETNENNSTDCGTNNGTDM